jgi:hypothetical protein
LGPTLLADGGAAAGATATVDALAIAEIVLRLGL